MLDVLKSTSKKISFEPISKRTNNNVVHVMSSAICRLARSQDAQNHYDDRQNARPSRDGRAIYGLFPKMNRAAQS